MINTNKIFIIISLSFLIGIILGNYLPLDLKLFLIILLILSILLIISWSEKLLKVFILTLIFLLLGILRFGLFRLREPKELINNLNNQKVKINGIISEEPDIRTDKTNLIIDVYKTQVFNNQQIIKNNYRLLAQIKNYFGYYYGDEIEIEGKLEIPPEFENFSYRDYLSRYNVYLIIKETKIRKIDSGKGNKVIHYLIKIKQAFIKRIDQTISEPQASLLAGILYGTKRMIPQEIIEKFNQTGLTHIVVISGYNITIIASLLLLVFNFLPKKLSFIFTFLGIILFTFFVGATPLVVRAAIMGSIGLLALKVKRKNNVFSSLVLAALIMVLINPKILIFDIGFQLSFLSTFGLIFLAPKIEKIFNFLPSLLNETLSLTLAAQFFAGPIILYNFRQISLIAPLANLLVLPIVPYLMIIGFSGSLISFLSINLGTIINWISWFLLTYIIKISNFLSQLPGAFLQFKINLWFLLIYYFILLGILLSKNSIKNIARYLRLKPVSNNEE